MQYRSVLAVLSLAVSSAFTSPSGLTDDMQLDVIPVLQSGATSCGEAAITMSYNYAYPDDPLEEAAVIQYAEREGLFTPGLAPFTSPEDMVRIAEYFAGPVQTGNVGDPDEGLALLQSQILAGNPVIVDVTTQLNDPDSGAHFVVVTGLATDPGTGEITIRYNNPLTGDVASAAWEQGGGIWQAWRDNGDPDGSGWWLVIPSGGLESGS